MVRDEFVVILSGFLEAENENEKLLTPVGYLKEVIALELGDHIPVWVVYRCRQIRCDKRQGRQVIQTYPEMFCAVPPRRQLTHDSLLSSSDLRRALNDDSTYESPCSKYCEINHCISLFAKPYKLGFLAKAKVARNWAANFDYDDRADEGEENDVISNKSKIKVAFGIAGVVWR